jgi:hypothetical protein
MINDEMELTKVAGYKQQLVKKASAIQNYPQKVNKSQFQTVSPHYDTCKNHLFDIMLMTC